MMISRFQKISIPVFVFVTSFATQLIAQQYTPDLANGKKYYELAGCSGCHKDDETNNEFSGGSKFETRSGTFYAPNISRSNENGIGNWTEEEFISAVKQGKARDNSSYTPIIFPFTSYASMRDEDVRDIYHYIFSRPPSDKKSLAHDLSLLSSLINSWSGENIWKLNDRVKDDNYGEYFVKAVGMCHECHAERKGLDRKIDSSDFNVDLFGEAPRLRLGKKVNYKGDFSGNLQEYFSSVSPAVYVENYLLKRSLSNGIALDNKLKLSTIAAMKNLTIDEHVSVYEYLSNKKLLPSDREHFTKVKDLLADASFNQQNEQAKNSSSVIENSGSHKLTISSDACKKPQSIEIDDGQSTLVTLPDITNSSDIASIDEIFSKKCNACHANGRADGGFRMSSAFEMQKDTPLLNALMSSIRDGSMPKGEKLTEEEYGEIKDWVSSAKSRPTLQPIENALKTDLEIEKTNLVETDFKPTPYEVLFKTLALDIVGTDEFDRPFIRYFDFSKVKYPALKCKSDQENYEVTHYIEAGFNKLINSLSLSPRLKKVTKLDAGNALIFKIDIRDYKWTREQWDTFTVGDEKSIKNFRWKEAVWDTVRYPYALNNASDPNLDLISKYTNAEIPIVEGTWFAKNALEFPMYDLFLGLTEQISDLENSLKLDVKSEIMNGDVVRAAMINTSGVSDNNRLIERFDIPTGGYYWKSYDFNNSVGEHSLELNPDGPYADVARYNFTPFAHAGGEMIFSLPNGLQGFYLSEADGREIQIGPVDIVSFKSHVPGKGVEIQNARSCFECHDNGLIKKSDNLRPIIEKSNFFDRAQRKRLLKMYVSQEELFSYFDEDRELYTASLEKLGVTSVNAAGVRESLRVPEFADQNGWKLRDRREIITFLADKYFQLMDLGEVAGFYGMSKETFVNEAKKVSNPVIAQLLLNWISRDELNRKLQREEFDQYYLRILEEISDFEGYSGQALLDNYKVTDESGISENGGLRSKLDVQVVLDGGNDKTVGDYLEFHIKTNDACRLQLFYVDALAGITELSSDERVLGPPDLKAGELRKIPYSSEVALQFDSPGKNETMLAYCTRTSPMLKKDVLQYIADFAQPLTRGIKIVAAQTTRASNGDSSYDAVTFNVK